MNYSKTIMAGYLTRDPETRHTNSGKTVVKFGLATNRTFKGSDGERKQSTCFIDVVAWGRTGEVIAEYLKKGDPIHVEGHLEFQTWEAKDGSGKRSKHELVVESFQFVGGSADKSGGGQTTKAATDGDIPF